MRINETRWRYVFGSPAGPVGRYLGRVGVRAESAAKVIATQEKLVRSGRYRASITWRPGKDGIGIFVQVGSAVPHAKIIEHGSPPHRILPGAVTGRSSKKALWWTHGADRGWYVPEHPLPGVNHPGTRAYSVIHRAIVIAARGG